MCHRLCHLVAAWVCLLAIGLDLTARALVPVVCISRGSTRAELVCSAGGPDVSVPTLSHERDAARSRADCRKPCRDIPLVGCDTAGVRPSERVSEMVPALACGAEMVSPRLRLARPVRFVGPAPSRVCQPADALARLRSIIITV